MKSLYQMRKLLFYVFVIFFSSTYAQDAWQQLGDFPVETRIKTSFATTNAAVVLTSVVPVGIVNVFAYDAISDSWEQRADFPYALGSEYTSFTLNNNGYVISNDAFDFNILLWKYNLAADTWEEKTGASYTSFGFGGFYGASFSINNLGYLLVSGGSEHFKEYNPISDTWTVKASYPSNNEGLQLGFSIGSKGYFAYNYDDFSLFPELWEYTPASDSWARKSDVPLFPFKGSAVFSIGEYGYLGMGCCGAERIFYRYSPAQNLWERVENCGYEASLNFSFSIGDIGYVGAGLFQDPSTGSSVTSREVWKLDPDLLSVVENDRNTDILLYPNPSEDTLSLYGIDAEVDYGIYNLSGGLISEGKTFNKSLDVSSIAKGVYILKITSEEKSLFKKFVKN